MNTSPTSISLEFSGLPPGPNVTSGTHWGSTHKEAQWWKEQVGWAAKAIAMKRGIEPYKRARICYQVSVGDNRAHDADNLIASLKHAQDGLKGILIEDDSIDHIEVFYSFDRTKPRRFTITVEEL